LTRIVFAIAALSSACGIIAQDNEANLSLAGSVLNSATGEVIPRAQVTITYFPIFDPSTPAAVQRAAPRVTSTSAMSDSAGAFRFSGLVPGKYILVAYKPGFSQGDPIQTFSKPVELKESTEGLQVTLEPLGVITGKVLDEEGQPVPGVNIIAISRQIVDGERRIKTNRTVVTDDQGAYRLWNMAPGKYYIKAAGRSGGTYLYAGDVAPRYGVNESFNPTYFGGSTAIDSAQAINIEAGTHAEADLRLTLDQSYRVRGSLGNFTPRRTVKFELLSGDEDVGESRVNVNGDTGRFEIQNVMPGSYVLRATQQEARGEVRVTVTNSDVNGLVATLSPGVDIKVHTRFTNTVADNPIIRMTRNMPIDRIDNRVCRFSLHPTGSRSEPASASPGNRPIDTQGDGDEQVLTGVLPGTYRATVECIGSYPRSAMLGTQDLLTHPLLSIQPGVSAEVEILATHGGGTVRGKVASEQNLANFKILVLLIPQFKPSTGPVMNRGGQILFFGLAPGTYTAYAFSNVDEVEFRNPEFLQALSGGVSVEVVDGKETTIEIPKLVQ